MVEGEFTLSVNPLFELADLRHGFKAAAEFALFRVAERLLADSRIFVPVLTGALKDSGHIEQMPSLDAAVSEIRVRYSMPYAERQHEVEYRHPSLGFYGAAKYLSKPLELYGRFYLELYTYEFDEYVRKNGLGT